MPVRLPYKFRKVFFVSLAGIGLIIFIVIIINKGFIKQKKEPYIIGIIINETELPDEGIAILKEIIAQKLQQLNENGGIDGHDLKADYINDQNNDKLLLQLVQETSKNPNLIAYVGCRGVSRSKILGPILTEKQIPFIGLYAFTDLFTDYPTMYTSGAGVKDARQVFLKLLKSKSQNIAFIGEKDHLFSQSYLKVIKELVADNKELSIAYSRFYPKGYIFTPSQNQDLADSLKYKCDFIVFLANPVSCNSFLDFIQSQNLHIPVYVAEPELALVDTNKTSYKNAELYALSTFGIPGAQNMRMMEQFIHFYKLKRANNQLNLDILVGGRIADEIGLIQEAAHNKLSAQRTTTIRERINYGLKQYINGNRIYHGWISDWYFTPEHAFSSETLLSWKPSNNTAEVLAPIQFLRTDSSLQQRQVLFTNLNLVEISQVNDNDGTFYATFYLEINSPQNISLKNIDFTNATRNEINHEALIETKLIRSKQDPKGHRFYNNLYQVSGKFYFQPDLKSYPLDQQKFPISIQASDPNQTFLVQPEQKQFRDSVFKSYNWIYNGQYMGYEQDIISSANKFYGKKKHFTYYKFSYVYIMKRTHIDFFLKTLVPLMAMLIITYFSTYIPLREFEAIAAIQVTALLSSIALYFSAYKPETDFATISDEIFIFNYIMITTLIGSSILMYIMQNKHSRIKPLARLYQRFIFPAIILVFTIYIRWF